MHNVVHSELIIDTRSIKRQDDDFEDDVEMPFVTLNLIVGPKRLMIRYYVKDTIVRV